MTTPRFRHASIAAAGLDVLHMTRLKVACSLLMAERVHAELRDWPGPDVHLLVAGTDDPHGIAAAEQGRQADITVLRIARDVGASGSALRHGATVKDLFDRLHALLTEGPPREAPVPIRIRVPPSSEPVVAAYAVASLPTALDLATDTAGTIAVLEHAGLRVAIDRRRGLLHLASAGDLDTLIATCAQPGWRMQAMADAAFEDRRAAFPCTRALETFVWRAAIALDVEVGDAPRTTAIGLKGWPIVESDTLPAHWLLPLTCLLHREWSSAALAQACGLPDAELARIFAAIHHSGLAQPAERRIARAPARAVAAADLPSAGFLARVARRFGMQFGGHRG